MRLAIAVQLYVLIDVSLPEPIDVYSRRQEAEQALAALLSDEPDWLPLLSIETIELPMPVAGRLGGLTFGCVEHAGGRALPDAGERG